MFNAKRSNKENYELCADGFRCTSDGTCISNGQRCNDIVRECSMNEDQLNCGNFVSFNVFYKNFLS